MALFLDLLARIGVLCIEPSR